ncbi:MAG: hypothetical protein Q8K64_16140 [Sediminibacterium sp.]|nr:hypothetical protein [Sediminibacterium sp.]
MSTTVKSTCNTNKAQLDLFTTNSNISSPVKSSTEANSQGTGENYCKVIVLSTFQKDQSINRFYEEVKKLSAHLD